MAAPALITPPLPAIVASEPGAEPAGAELPAEVLDVSVGAGLLDDEDGAAEDADDDADGDEDDEGDEDDADRLDGVLALDAAADVLICVVAEPAALDAPPAAGSEPQPVRRAAARAAAATNRDRGARVVMR